jgi:hypothetical protein
VDLVVRLLRHEILRTDFERFSGFAWFYVSFNVLETLIWLGIAIFIIRRALRGGAPRGDQLAYAGAFILFGVSDLLEVVALPVWLLLAKGIVLAAIVLLRRRVLRRYPGAKM